MIMIHCTLQYNDNDNGNFDPLTIPKKFYIKMDNE